LPYKIFYYRGFGYVEFKTLDAANEAVNRLNGFVSLAVINQTFANHSNSEINMAENLGFCAVHIHHPML
jgi:RNA recognition motif-containing protein